MPRQETPRPAGVTSEQRWAYEQDRERLQELRRQLVASGNEKPKAENPND